MKTHLLEGKPSSAYPLQRRLVGMGIGLGVVLSFLMFDPAYGAVLAIPMICIGLMWRRDEPPILPFCFTYQSLFVVSGFLYFRMTGMFPGYMGSVGVEEVSMALWLSLIGLLVVALGFRLAFFVLGRYVRERERGLVSVTHNYDIKRLFWLNVALFGVEWFVEVTPMRIFFQGAQVLYALLAFRTVLLFLFFRVAVRQRQGYAHAVMLFLFALVPSVSSPMSNFKEYFFLLFVALLGEWRPWVQVRGERRKGRRPVVLAVMGGAVLVSILLVWQHTFKNEWRWLLSIRGEDMTRTEKLHAFADLIPASIEMFAWEPAMVSVLDRTSSGFAYFTLALRHVPESVPHEGGELTLRALRHVLVPRIVDPGKPNLGGDSWLVERYAGVRVAGPAEGTSIGFTYIGQAYVDFGLPFMFVPLLILGALLGTLHRLLLFPSPSYPFYLSAVTVLFLQHFVGYESELAKMLGGIGMSFIIFSLLLGTAGRLFHRAARGNPRPYTAASIPLSASS